MQVKQLFFIFLVLYGCINYPRWLPFRESETSSEKPLLVLGKQDEKKTIRTMSFEELKAQKNVRLSEGNKEMAIKYLEKMIPLCDDLGELGSLYLEIADLSFECDKLKQAEQYYREFCTLYPGDEKIEYALYKAILCSFRKILDADRDQTKTDKTIELTDSFLQRHEIFTTYTSEVEKIRRQCLVRLAESEIGIVKDYTNRKSYKSAQRRIEYIIAQLFEELPEFEAQLTELQNLLCELQGIEDKPLALASNTQEAVQLSDEQHEEQKTVIQEKLFGNRI